MIGAEHERVSARVARRQWLSTIESQRVDLGANESEWARACTRVIPSVSGSRHEWQSTTESDNELVWAWTSLSGRAHAREWFRM